MSNGPGSTRFAGYASPKVYQNPDGTKAIQQLLWGDWLRLKAGVSGDYREVHARGVRQSRSYASR